MHNFDMPLLWIWKVIPTQIEGSLRVAGGPLPDFEPARGIHAHVYACAETLFCNITMTAYRKTNQDESTLITSLVVGRSDGCPRGPTNGLAADNNVRGCPKTTTACMCPKHMYGGVV